jgi:hypothetical protein
MAEWSKARDSKSRKPQKGFEGSNPSLSAIQLRPLDYAVMGFLFWFGEVPQSGT